MKKLKEIQRLRELVHKIFNSSSRARDWFKSEVPFLDYQAPYSVLKSGHVKRIIKLLAGLHSGTYI